MYEHIDGILALNRKYLITYLPTEEKRHGFVRVEYTYDDIKQIIDQKEVIIALNENTIIGYYLIGRKSRSKRLEYQAKKVAEIFKDADTIDQIGYGAQAIIEKEFRGGDLLNMMLLELIKALDHKYTFLFSSVTKINESAFRAHAKGGYEILSEDESKYYVGLSINKL